jgi:hypothetical protein
MASNLPSGWEAFQILRQTPAPYRPKRHGLWRHGYYSAEGIARRRRAREAFRWMRRGCYPPQPPKPPVGWLTFRTVRAGTREGFRAQYAPTREGSRHYVVEIKGLDLTLSAVGSFDSSTRAARARDFQMHDLG